MQVKHLYLENGSINPNLYEDSFVIWGMGGEGERLWQSLPDDAREKVICFLDSDMKKVGMKFHGKPICHSDTLKNLHDDVCVALAFNAWPEVESLISDQNYHVFADYRYEHEPTGGGQTCIVCGGTCVESKAHFAPFIEEREFLGHPPTSKLVTCKDCGLSFSSYRPNDEEMARLYTGYRGEEYYNTRHKHEPQYTQAENNRYTTDEYISLRRNRLQNFIAEYVSGVKTVLDYGGDKGQFIPERFKDAKKYVFDISGIKPCDGVENICRLDDLFHQEFDFVMCCHLLEHVSNPMEIAANLARCVAQGGYVYVEVPYETRFLRYSDYAFHEHINFFTEEALRALGKRLHWNVVKWDTLGGSILRMLYRA